MPFRSFLILGWDTTVFDETVIGQNFGKKCGSRGILSIHTLKGLIQLYAPIVGTPTPCQLSCSDAFALNFASDIRTIEPSFLLRNGLIERNFIYVDQHEISLICAVILAIILANPTTFLALTNRMFYLGSPKKRPESIVSYLASLTKMGLPILPILVTQTLPACG